MFDFIGKSLPIHCVIEVISGPAIPGRGDRGRDGSGKSETSPTGGGVNSSGNNGRSSPGNGTFTLSKKLLIVLQHLSIFSDVMDI